MTLATQKTIETPDYRGPAQNRFEATTERSRANTRIVTWLVGGSALLLVLGGYWYFNHSHSDAPAGGRFSAAAVRVAKVERRDMTLIERTIGTVMSSQTVQVTSQVPGFVQSANFKEGQLVKKGDLLFQIDPRPFRAAFDQARGQLAKDSAALAGARRDLKRFQALMAAGAESQQVLDDEMATVATDEGVVQADNANVETAQINLGYTQIRSPVDGKTGPILVQPGNMVTSASSATLVTINQIQPIKVSFSLPQSDLPRIQARQKVRGLVAAIDLRDEGGKSISAPVDFISNNVNNTSGTIELRATFANEDSSLVPGQLVNVVVELSDIPGATVVPREAVNTGPDGQYVFVVTPDKKAAQRSVRTLFDDGVNAAVQGDVRPGEQVITDGQLRVIPGAGVFVEGSKPTPAAGGKGRRGRRRKAG
jgi:multidrug efflux system membrane fusion protein